MVLNVSTSYDNSQLPRRVNEVVRTNFLFCSFRFVVRLRSRRRLLLIDSLFVCTWFGWCYFSAHFCLLWSGIGFTGFIAMTIVIHCIYSQYYTHCVCYVSVWVCGCQIVFINFTKRKSDNETAGLRPILLRLFKREVTYEESLKERQNGELFAEWWKIEAQIKYSFDSELIWERKKKFHAEFCCSWFHMWSFVYMCMQDEFIFLVSFISILLNSSSPFSSSVELCSMPTLPFF